MKRLLVITVILMGTFLSAQDQDQVFKRAVYGGTPGAWYAGTYRLALTRGLIRISTQGVLQDGQFVISIKRHNKNTVFVRTKLGHKTMSKYDQHYIGSRKFWLPWQDDTLQDKNNGRLRAGNRLSLDLNIAGSYEIIIPHDADVEAELMNQGTIVYSAKERTRMHIEDMQNNKVYKNKHRDGRVLPITKLKNKYGEIILSRDN